MSANIQRMNINCLEIIDNIPIGVYFTDCSRKITFWNRHAENITGYLSAEVVGCHCHDNILMHIDENGDGLCNGLCPLAMTIEDGILREAQVFLRHKQGHRKIVRVHTFQLKDDQGKVVGAAEFFMDISLFSEIERRAKELEKIAYMDGLTQLPNREHVESKLKALIQEHQRYGMKFAVFFIDIDHFKQFNDTYGHEAGDRVLKTIAATFRSASRPFDLFGRWGGEEFVGLIRHIDSDTMAQVGRRYRKLIEKSSIDIDGKSIHITISIGGTLALKTDTIESVIRRADRLMYQSKQKGRNCLTTD